MPNRQAEFAEVLCEELQICGHDIDPLHILDALATCGLALIPDETVAARDAYHRWLEGMGWAADGNES